MRSIGLLIILSLFCMHGDAVGQVVIRAQRVQAAQVQLVGEAENEDNPNKPKEAPECLRPLINVELSFVKRVCEPTDEQMTKIVEAAIQAHKAMADIVTPQGAAERIRVIEGAMFMGQNQERISVNPYQRIREDMAKLLVPLISAEQYTKYEEESKLREHYERETAVGIVLDMIDSRLVLSTDQRQQISEKLMSKWKEVDVLWLQNYRNNPNYLPTMPEHLFEQVLTDSQKELWDLATMQKVTMFSHINQGNQTGFTEEWIKP
jgi:hypothetical protein